MWSCSLNLLLLPGLWPPHPSAVCSILQYSNRTKPSADTWAIEPWVRVVPSFLCTSLFQSVCVQVGDDVFFLWQHEIYLWYLPGTAGPYSGPSPVDLACLRNHLLLACRYWYCGSHPQDTAVGRDRTHCSFWSIRAVVYGFSSNMRSKWVGLRRVILVFICIFYARLCFKVYAYE